MSTRQRVAAWWRGLSVRTRVHLALLLLITGAAVGHQVTLWYWFIEDAAISFAYAKHVAMGEGLVPFPGSERVEGYSNPLWVLLLTAVHVVGLDVFETVKWIQVGLTAATVLVTYLAAREVTSERSHVPIVAAALLAANSQFAIWGSAGLENGLMNLLFALALWRMWVEVRTGHWPWSALLWLAVALCRPEAILYAAIAGFLSMVFHLIERRSLLPTVKWLILFFVPFTAYQLVRYEYFAWPFPNTFYAKDKDPDKIRWTTRAWKWSRRYYEDTGQAYFLPVYLLGLLGHRRWRLPVAAVAFLVVGVTLELSDEQRWLLPVILGFTFVAFWTGLKASEQEPPRWLVVTGFLSAIGLVVVAELLRTQGFSPNELPTPDWVRLSAPPWVLVTSALLLPLLSAGTRGWQARVTCWFMVVGATFFAIWAQGDWMKGFRWYSVAAVPGSILLAIGIDSVALLAQEMVSDIRDRWTWPGTTAAMLLVAAFVPLHVKTTMAIVDSPDARPQGILKRVHYVESIRDRLHHHGTWVDLDVDMGAHLYWSDFWMHDIAGLVDLPLGHHRFERAFVKEYLFDEVRPHYAHVHGGWATNSRITTMAEWRKGYVEIPGYPAGRSQFHIGNHVRRDLLLPNQWPHEPRRVAFQGGVFLEGFRVPSEPAAARRMYLEVGVRVATRRTLGQESLRLWMGLADAEGHLFTVDLPLGYDWVSVQQWAADEVFVGRFSPLLPEDLPPGTYTAVFVLVDHDGTVVAATPDDETPLPAGTRVADGVDVQPFLAVGEVQFPDEIVVLSLEDRGQAAIDDREQALALADDLACEEAEDTWSLSRAHRPRDDEWMGHHGPVLDRALATCWALRSDQVDTREARIEALDRARDLDHWTPAYLERAAPLAAELHAEGLVAREDEDWERAYRLFADAIRIDRTRSWSRRYAEEARAHRLGFDDETKARQQAERERRRVEMEERREAAAAKRDAAAAARKKDGEEQPDEDRRPRGREDE